jgi:hypothetical protein
MRAGQEIEQRQAAERQAKRKAAVEKGLIYQPRGGRESEALQVCMPVPEALFTGQRHALTIWLGEGRLGA